MDTDVTPPADRMTELRELAGRAKAGDATAVPRLRELLTEAPKVAAANGDLGVQAIMAWLRVTAGDDLFLAEAVSHKLDDLRQQLGGANPGPILDLAVDRVLVSWLICNHSVLMEAKALTAKEGAKLVAFLARRRAQAERNHLQALAALAALKKFLPPAAAAPAGAETRPPVPDVANRLAGYFGGKLPGGRRSPAVAAN